MASEAAGLTAVPDSVLPFAYSSNLHAAETCAEIGDALRRFAGPLRRELGWERLGVDLRLGTLALHGDLGLIRRALDEHALSAHTLNGFPLRPFQATRVKEDAYLPDWSESARYEESLRLIDAALLLSDAAEITVSTCPGSFRPLGPARNAAVGFAVALGRWAAAAHRVRLRTGRSVVLCPEPEPWCQLETSWEVAAFWQGALADAGLRAAQAALDGDAAAARLAIARQLGVCFDTCHLSLAFEDQAAAVQRIRAAGARIVKVQVSAAPEADLAWSGQATALAMMDEPRFLHQSAARDAAGGVVRCVDLPELPSMLGRLPGAVVARSHFHVPIDAEVLGNGLRTTAADSRLGLAAATADDQPHLAVETYTWPLLAADEAARRAGTARELRTLAAWMA